VWNSGFMVQGAACRVEGLEFSESGVQGLGFRIHGCGIQGLWFRVQDAGLRV
jgi:hypothetical protein